MRQQPGGRFFTTAKLCAIAALASSFGACTSSNYFAALPDPPLVEIGTHSGSESDFSTLQGFSLGRQPYGSVSKAEFHLRNSGELAARIKEVAIDPPSAKQHYSIKNFCGATLAPNGAVLCRIQLEFSPKALGQIPARLRVVYEKDGITEQDEKEGRAGSFIAELPISAESSNLAHLRFEAEKLNIGTSTLGYSRSATIRVVYNGTAARSAGFTIQPAKGVSVLDPANARFTVVRESSTCGSIVDQDCFLTVEFRPGAATKEFGKLALSYFNGAESPRAEAELEGEGLQAAVLATLSAAAVDFGKVVVQPLQPSRAVFQVKMSGSVPAEQVKISSLNNPAFVRISPLTDTGRNECADGSWTGDCWIELSFNPQTLGDHNDELTFTYSSNGQERPMLKVAIRGKAVSPALLAPVSLTHAFGPVPVHKKVWKSFILKNTGELSLQNFSVTLAGSSAFAIQTDAKCSALTPGDTCTLKVSFHPSIGGDESASITLSYFDGKATKTLTGALSGTGTEPLVLEYQDSATINFGNVMIGKLPLPVKSVKVNYFGTALLSNGEQLGSLPSSLGPDFAFPGGAFPGSGDCKAPLNPNLKNRCSFNVQLASTSGYAPDQLVSRNFELHYSADGGAGSGSLAYTAKATFREPPRLAFVEVPGTVRTVSVGDRHILQYKVKNLSPYFSASIKAVAVEGVADFTQASNSCSGTLSAGSTCTIRLEHQPREEKSYSGLLRVTYNDQIADDSMTASVSGIGSGDVTLAADRTSINFGKVYLGDAPKTEIVRLSYFGLKTWTPTASADAPFSIDLSDCGTARDCEVKITFAPVDAGSFSKTFSLDYAPKLSGAPAVSVSLTGVAEQRKPNILVKTTGFPKVLLGAFHEQDVQIQNTGTAAATDLEYADLSAGVFAYAAGGAPGDTGRCGVSLAAGASCTLRIRFMPDQVGAATVPFQVINRLTSDSLAAAQLTGTGTVPIQVFAGYYQTCIINELEEAVCWGKNDTGQLGQGSAGPLSTAPQNITPIKFGSGVRVRKLAVGASHTCAILSFDERAGGISCWGSNASGRLGLGSSSTDSVLKPSLTAGGRPVVLDLGTDENGAPEEAFDIAAGFEHTCAALMSGKVKCWGGNTSGQLGTGDTLSVGSAPEQMGEALREVNLKGLDVAGISAGAGHSCAVLSDGTSKCWGDNFYGQLGQGTGDARIGDSPSHYETLEPIQFGAGSSVRGIFASTGAFTCALLKSGEIKCFGKTVDDEKSSSPFYGLLGACWARSSYNSKAYSCAEQPRYKPSGAIGYYATDMGDALPPVQLAGGETRGFAMGHQFSCSLAADDRVRCWGVNERGQLGNGSRANVGLTAGEMGEQLAVTIGPQGPVRPMSVAAGSDHACVTLSDNRLKCWGADIENATGLRSLGHAGDALSPADTPVVYDGTR